jgi:hypothetical protein
MPENGKRCLRAIDSGVGFGSVPGRRAIEPKLWPVLEEAMVDGLDQGATGVLVEE